MLHLAKLWESQYDASSQKIAKKKKDKQVDNLKEKKKRK